MPKISLVMPVYNGEKYIRQSVAAILNQTLKDFELILVDDGSKDLSGNICDEYAKNDVRIKVIHKENGGAGSARNAGIKIAAGKYLSFPDCDDWVDSDMYEIMYQAAEINNVDVVLCGAYFHMADGKKEQTICKKYLADVFCDKKALRREFFNSYKYQNKNFGFWFGPWNKLYKTEVIKRHELEFSNMRRAQDAYFNADFFDVASSAAVIDKCLYHYRANNLDIRARKYSSDMFKNQLILSNKFLDIAKGWDVLDKNVEQILKIRLLYLVAELIENLYSPNCPLDKNEKLNYINDILKNKTVNDALEACDSLSRKYIRKVIRLLKKNNIKGALRVVKTKIILKEHLRPVFNFIKILFLKR
ncbi:MAG: glycosyltransferase [Eubacteriales bacterium]